ncbi:9836_t:CDS:2 [Scutellospora calospora]|uniref:9836_t:CDS:1 n=1 Tax=Scutellospora calospora TaxID=85575 RepID=A0ACA9LM95_9GLOM|nr:9836_t:CDS:2 [Scutellospora calospora]
MESQEDDNISIVYIVQLIYGLEEKVTKKQEEEIKRSKDKEMKYSWKRKVKFRMHNINGIKGDMLKLEWLTDYYNKE